MTLCNREERSEERRRPSGISNGKSQMANLKYVICNSSRSEDSTHCFGPESAPFDRPRA
jgi:hypothetical protein